MKRFICMFFIVQGLLISGCSIPNSKSVNGDALANNESGEITTTYSRNTKNAINNKNKEIKMTIGKLAGCYENSNKNKMSQVSLSSLIWTKKQLDSNYIKKDSVVLFSGDSKNQLNIMIIVDGYPLRKDILSEGVDFDVKENAVHINNAFGASINNGVRPNAIVLQPGNDVLTVVVNDNTRYVYLMNDKACELQKMKAMKK